VFIGSYRAFPRQLIVCCLREEIVIVIVVLFLLDSLLFVLFGLLLH
jgi:hypothetical protein